MTKYFGTDGIRGIVGTDVTDDIAYLCGRALTELTQYPRVVVGRDTRISGETLTKALSSGLIMGGGEVVDLGIVTTPTVSWAVTNLGCDYGVVISASHNPAEHNGIKIFDKNGAKLAESEENEIEAFIDDNIGTNDIIMGSYCHKPLFWRKYCKYLINTVTKDVSKLKVVIDCSNGAGFKSAPYVFRKLGMKVVVIHNSSDGKLINVNCGSQHTTDLQCKVVEHKADFGFALDGDGDRIIAVDDKGQVVDGDMILYVLSKYYKAKGKLTNDSVVGTVNTNIAIEKELALLGVKLFRSKVGDKYVRQLMHKQGSVLGAEQSGHVIVGEYVDTGDGTATALQIANMLADLKVNLSELTNIKLCPQQNINVVVHDKLKVINDCKVQDLVNKYAKLLEGSGRVVLRASGTESKVRVMVECIDEESCVNISTQIADLIKKIDKLSNDLYRLK